MIVPGEPFECGYTKKTYVILSSTNHYGSDGGHDVQMIVHKYAWSSIPRGKPALLNGIRRPGGDPSPHIWTYFCVPTLTDRENDSPLSQDRLPNSGVETNTLKIIH